MYAVVVRVNVGDDGAAATQALREEIVPRVSQREGFVAGYWVRLGGSVGTSVIVFESEQNARALADDVQTAPGVSLESVDVGEVVANA